MTHDRSCLLDAFAVALDVSNSELRDAIGHYGIRGYHTQELIEYCVNNGYSVTPIERAPVATNVIGQTWEVRFPEGFDGRFARHLETGNGVILGHKNSGLPHAVAWVDGAAFDPGINIWLSILDENGLPDDEYFCPMTFLRIDRWRV